MVKEAMWLIPGLLIIASLMFIFVINKTFNAGYYLDIVLAENIEITDEFTELNTKKLTEIRKDNQFVSIALASPLELAPHRRGIETPDGSVINPEIILIDENDQEYVLSYVGSRAKGDMKIVNYGFNEEVILGTTF